MSAAIAVILLSGCNSNGEAAEQNLSAVPITTKQIVSPAGPPTSQVNNGTRGTVKFDPCTEFDDPAIQRAGYDAETRKRTDGIHEWYAFVGCSFEDREPAGTFGMEVPIRSIDISATNITLDEFRQRYAGNHTEESVGGRNAIKYTPPMQCGIVIEFPDFALDLTTSTFAGFTDEKPCDNILTAATVLEGAATSVVGSR
ncbi:DUF3558 family protein [Nocardia neocaledoniensis]|uniref:DUF3558 family protein n=1 Tax=Nocardia neocaledoniensis TaxID=236511 RepID=UPI0024538000|nr:DUF3558 family protein [Nocardia neocaledoniensis]